MPDEDKQLETAPTRGEYVWATPDMTLPCSSLMVFITTLDLKKIAKSRQADRSKVLGQISPAS